MRICVVGCGAVGSLFAANLAQLDDVEVWAYDASREHVDAINANGLRLSGAGEVLGRLHATTDAARAARRATSASSRRRRCTPTPAIERDGARLRRRLRRDRAERARQRGDARRARRARDPRHDVPRGQDRRAGPRAVGREGRHDARPVRAAAGAVRGGRAARRRVHARRHADARGRATRAARSGAR